jgi:hypothetical protein
MTETTYKTGYKRGVMRNLQPRDPYINDALRHFDMTLRNDVKVYSRKTGSEQDLADLLWRYDVPQKRILNAKLRDSFNHAVTTVRERLKLREKAVPTFILNVDMVLNTSSGYPKFAKKKDIEQEIRQGARKLFHHMKRLDRPRIGYPYVAPAAKGGLSDDPEHPKTRFVWMYPATMLNCEAVFAQPLIKAMYENKSEHFLAGKYSHRHIPDFLMTLDEGRRHAGIGLDFSKYDRLPCVELIEKAFEILNDNIDHGKYWDPVNGVKYGGRGVVERSKMAFENVKEYFINTPIILPNGRVITKHVGVPSGSNFTNLIDSIVNMIMHETFKHYYSVPMRMLMVNGDDSAFITDSKQSQRILKVAQMFFETAFSMTVNVKKSCVALTPSEMHLSGTAWTRSKRTRSTTEWFSLAFSPKSYVSNPFESFQRLLGVGIAGGFHDHKYSSFVDYFQTGYNLQQWAPNLLDWTRYRWMEFAYGITNLPKVYKQDAKLRRKIGVLMFRC